MTSDFLANIHAIYAIVLWIHARLFNPQIPINQGELKTKNAKEKQQMPEQ